jgi:tetratricopeptide (TPR) repeat protein
MLLAWVLAPGAASAAECVEWAATAVSLQGRVEVRRAGASRWEPVAIGGRYCLGDTIRVLDRSRAAVRLRNDAVLRLDQHSTITFLESRGAESWIELARRSLLHVLSRLPRTLRVVTPFVNGTVEGTEFAMDVGDDRTTLTVFAGRVVAENALGRLALADGESAVARAGQPPAPLVQVRPRDAAEWTLHYPSIRGYRAADVPDVPGEDWPARVRRSIEAYRSGDLAEAFAPVEPAPAGVRDPRFSTYRATLWLAVGRVAEARADLAQALRLDPRNAQALALEATIAVARNDDHEALRLARAAVGADPVSAPAHVALSYARQATADLSGALESLQEAVRLDPGHALAHARRSEILLAFRRTREAVAAAEQSVALDPGLARAHAVLGFALLARLDVDRARQSFEQAIRIDPADPLPRLGLGLVKIRRGQLAEGRGDLEIAASLDPGRALLRTYLGRAYDEERRNRPAAEEFGIAKRLDPNDPTPWFYDAIRKHSVNRPVEALSDLQRAIELNDNRAIYRSRRLLDEDLAARGAGLAQIYRDLGFEQLALVEGFKSSGVDPANAAAHRFLAESYAILPRHEIARVSEILQWQLLQPEIVTPVPPQLSLARPFFLRGAGPASPGFNEYNALFTGNGVSALGSIVGGTQATFADEVAVAGRWNDLSFSVGQFHYESDGFRRNNDLTQDVYNAIVQYRLGPGTAVQVEARHTRFESGDLQVQFDPTLFFPTFRDTEEATSIRAGLRHDFTPDSTLLASFIYQWSRITLSFGPGAATRIDQDGFSAEAQHLYRSTLLGRPFHVVTGLGDTHAARTVGTLPLDHIDHLNGYAYATVRPVGALDVTVGASVDSFRGGVVDADQVNPKLGVLWNPFRATTVRAAVFRTLNRTLTSNQTLEPTQVAGFNQFFQDGEGTDAWRYGIGVDQRITRWLAAGGEFSRRHLTVPGLVAFPAPAVVEGDWNESLGRAYAYATPLSWLALSAEYQYERFQRDLDFFNFGADTDVKTHRVPLGLSVFAPWGGLAGVKGTYIDQHGDFGNPSGGVTPGHDRFWLVDAFVGYRLPRRLGLITLEVKNLLDKQFRFQDTDPANPVFRPERLVLGRATFAY